MQQISHSPPPGHGHSTQPLLGPEGLTTEVVELLDDIGSIVSTGSMGKCCSI